MVQDVSGFGTVLNIIADTTYPTGITVTQFSNDVDPLDMPSIKIADTAMGVNGDLQVWAKATPIEASISVVVGSPDDVALQQLYDNNRVGPGKISTADIITLSVFYPDLTTVTVYNGRCTDYMPGKSISGEGRLKTRVYKMMFESKIGVA